MNLCDCRLTADNGGESVVKTVKEHKPEQVLLIVLYFEIS
jgi:hypothetical protein